MKRRIIISLGLLLGLSLLGNVIAMVSLDRSIRRLRALAELHRIQSMRADLTSNSVRLDRDLLSHLAGHEHSQATYQNSIHRVRRSIGQCGGCHHEPGIQAELDQVRETFQAYRRVSDQLHGGGGLDAQPSLRRQAEQLADQLVEQATRLSDRAGRHLAVKSTDVAASVRNAWLALIGTLGAVLVAGGGVAFHLLRRLTRPVDALLEGIQRVREGDLDYRFSLRADREFATLASALNEAYKSLKKAQDSVLQAEKMAALGKLAAGVAHEVGNPLASISSIVQVMRRRCSSQEEAERIGLIMDEVNRISRIVRELLTFSRPGSGLKQGPVQIGDLLDRATRLLGYDKRSRGIRVTCRHEADLPPVRGDADKLLLVFTNIMINAFDALETCQQDDAALTVTACREDRCVVARFQDNGPGMSEERLSYVFEPFFTTKEPGAGTGLGLWICYQVVQQHEGTIQLDSRLGVGTTVTVSLPYLSPEDAQAPDRPASEASLRAKQTTGGPTQ